MLAATVLTLHGLALHATQIGPAAARQTAPPPLSVRTIEPQRELPPAIVEHTIEPLVPAPAVRRARRVASLGMLMPIAAVEAVEPVKAPSADRPAAAAPAASAATPPDEPIPVYRTTLAAPMLLRYELRRGGLTGTGELTWKPAGKIYELRLDGRIAGLTLLTQISQGAIDAHGLAPLRFTDQRIRRPAQVANFQRDKNLITFSGPPNEYALVPGAQDRLSWMMQLGAVVSADARRARAGQKVVFHVIGSRGEADVWAFNCIGTEALPTRDGEVRAIKFVREPRRPFDTQIEVWLDPARQHIPIRAKQTSGQDGDVFELTLRGVESPP